MLPISKSEGKNDGLFIWWNALVALKNHQEMSMRKYFLFNFALSFSGWSSVHRSLHTQSIAYQWLLSASRYAHEKLFPHIWTSALTFSEMLFFQFFLSSNKAFLINDWCMTIYSLPFAQFGQMVLLSYFDPAAKDETKESNYNIFQFCPPVYLSSSRLFQ